jgi:hypothetical protein
MQLWQLRYYIQPIFNYAYLAEAEGAAAVVRYSVDLLGQQTSDSLTEPWQQLFGWLAG